MAHSTIDATERSERGNRYGPTAAREPTSADRPSTITIDAHAHVLIPEAAQYAKPHLGDALAPMVAFSNDASRVINHNQVEDRRHAMADQDDRIAVLDAMRLDAQVIAPPPVQCYPTLSAEHAARAIAMVNDGIAAYVERRPERFAGLGTVPFLQPERAAEELRAVMARGLKGVMILTSYGNEEVAAPRFEPFWKAAQELDAVVMIHPDGFSGGERFCDYYLSNVLGNPLDTTVALHHIILGGLLERLPDLKIFAVHGGGYLPAYAGRIDHAWGARDDTNAALPHPPTTYLRKIFLDTIVFTHDQLETLVRLYGAERILMGTDSPFDMAEYDPVGHVMGSALSQEDKRKICGETSAALFGL